MTCYNQAYQTKQFVKVENHFHDSTNLLPIAIFDDIIFAVLAKTWPLNIS